MTETESPAQVQALDAALRVTDWRAWHVFVHHPLALENVLVDCLNAEMAALGGASDAFAWFFIRYWENGPHFRIRVRGADDEAFLRLGLRLSEGARQAAAETPAAISAYPDDMPVDGWHSSANAAPWLEEGAAIEVAYEPEYRRYGGVVALALAERVFENSSKLAMPIVKQTMGDMGRRQSVGLELTATAIGLLAPDRAAFANFASSMSEGWRGFVTDHAPVAAQIESMHENAGERIAQCIGSAIEAADIGRSTIAAKWRALLVNYFEALRELHQGGKLVSPLTGMPPRDEDEFSAAIANILFSQIHMMNNRLGLSPTNEYIFAKVLLKSL